MCVVCHVCLSVSACWKEWKDKRNRHVNMSVKLLTATELQPKNLWPTHNTRILYSLRVPLTLRVEPAVGFAGVLELR